MTPNFNMAEAPAGDGWILGLIDQNEHWSAKQQPWVLLTRCDKGWTDDDGHYFSPRAWALLPDPQPEPTGFRPIDGGYVNYQPAQWLHNGVPVPEWTWNVILNLSDGEYDWYRDEAHHAGSFGEAKSKAIKLAAKYGVPVRHYQPETPKLTASSIPIVRKVPDHEGPHA